MWLISPVITCLWTNDDEVLPVRVQLQQWHLIVVLLSSLLPKSTHFFSFLLRDFVWPVIVTFLYCHRETLLLFMCVCAWGCLTLAALKCLLQTAQDSCSDWRALTGRTKDGPQGTLPKKKKKTNFITATITSAGSIAVFMDGLQCCESCMPSQLPETILIGDVIDRSSTVTAWLTRCLSFILRIKFG